MAQKSEGISSNDLVEVLMCGALASPIVNAKGKAVSGEKFDVNFPLKHQQKDMKLAIDLGKEVGMGEMKMAETANKLFENKLEECGDEDMHSVEFWFQTG